MFVYGSLRPGRPAWPLLAGHAVGRPRDATVPGQVFDTEPGYPALLPGGEARAAGQVIAVRDPVALLRRLDRYEGDDYRRIRVAAAPDGDSAVTACWTYAWTGDEAALRSEVVPPRP